MPAARSFNFSLVNTTMLMDSRLMGTTFFGERSSALRSIANHVMGTSTDYRAYGVQGGRDNFDVHMTSAQSALRRQHPEIERRIDAFLESHPIIDSAAADSREAFNAAYANNDRVALTLWRQLEAEFGTQVLVSPVDPIDKSSLVIEAMKILGITPMLGAGGGSVYVSRPQIDSTPTATTTNRMEAFASALLHALGLRRP